MKDVIVANLPDPVRKIARKIYRDVKDRTRFEVDRVLTRVVRGKKLKLAVASKMERFRFDSFDTKEPETLEWLESQLGSSDVLFDIGANIGQYSIFAGLVSPAAQVFAFEPESQNFSRLCINIALNELRNVVPCGFPLSAKGSFGFFHVSHLAKGCSLHSFGRPSEYSESPPILRQLAVSSSIDDLVASGSVPVPTLIKLDVDGLERQILEGARETLKSGQVKSLLIEVNAPVTQISGTTEIEKYLSGFGYKVSQKSEWTDVVGESASKNYIFAKV